MAFCRKREALRQLRVARDHGAADHVGVAVEVLGRRVHDDGRAQLERPLQHGRREGVVDDQRDAARARSARRAAAMSKSLSSGLVGVSSQTMRVRGGERRSQTRRGSRRSTKLDSMPSGCMTAVEDAEGAAVDVVAADHVVARAQRVQQRRRGGAAAREGKAAAAALERRQARLQRRARGVAAARVVEAQRLARLGCAKVLERTMGFITAPFAGSGAWPAWMAERFEGGAALAIALQRHRHPQCSIRASMRAG